MDHQKPLQLQNLVLVFYLEENTKLLLPIAVSFLVLKQLLQWVELP